MRSKCSLYCLHIISSIKTHSSTFGKTDEWNNIGFIYEYFVFEYIWCLFNGLHIPLVFLAKKICDTHLRKGIGNKFIQCNLQLHLSGVANNMCFQRSQIADEAKKSRKVWYLKWYVLLRWHFVLLFGGGSSARKDGEQQIHYGVFHVENLCVYLIYN